jgi:glutamate 5-kinase
LPAGVAQSRGCYEEYATVSICTLAGQEIARGLVNYPAYEVEKIKGAKSTDIENLLGHKPFDEIIHRDNLVIMTKEK